MDQSDSLPDELGISRLHGLIIGINQYKALNRPDLRGCVADAMSMRNYFTDLGVPSENLRCLLDKDATRERILDAFETHLIKNSRIRAHDPIVIYFAGYGDRMPAPRHWNTSGGMVDLIISYDTGYENIGSETSNTRVNYKSSDGKRRISRHAGNGKYIHGVPDLTLAFLLYRLREAKGNNITVILDCCPSGSDSRDEVRVRSSNDPDAPPIPDNLDVKLRESTSTMYPSKPQPNAAPEQPWRNLMALSSESHILLAACRSDEQAYEVPNIDTGSANPSFKGIFTTALLEELRKSDLEVTSYATLMRNLLATNGDNKSNLTQDIGPQTFQCEGQDQNWPLFNVGHFTFKGKTSLISTDDKSVYRIKVGIAHGIVPGMEFQVLWDSIDPAAPPIVLIAREVGTIAAQLHCLEPNTILQIPESAYATVTKHKEHSKVVRVWVDERIRKIKLWQEVLEHLDSRWTSWATSPEHYDLALFPVNEDVELRGRLILGQLTTSHTLERSLDPIRLAEIINAVIFFHADLKDHNPNAPVCAHFGMTLHELKVKNNPEKSTIYEAIGDDLFGDSISTGVVAPIQCDPDKVYGLKLTNTSTEDLYPYVLYYDSEDCSIGDLYQPPQLIGPRLAPPPLRAGQSLTIGYGDQKSEPFQVSFTNPESEKEYGAFVLMVFDKWVQAIGLTLDSPFEAGWSASRHDRHFKKPPVWDIVVARVEVVKVN